MKTPLRPPPLLSTQETADRLNLPIKTLYNWARRGSGPPRYRIGRHTRYRAAEVDAWILSQQISA